MGEIVFLLNIMILRLKKGSLRKCENGIEVTLTGNLIVPKR